MATKAATVKKSAKPVSVSTTSLKKFGSPLKESAFIGSLIAEVLGVFMLAGMFILSQGQPIIMLFAVTGIVMLVGNLSGAHLNPAVSIAAWVTKKVSTLRALAYVVAQFVGAALAFGLLQYFVNGAPAVSAESAMYGQSAPQLYQALAIPEGKEYYILVAEIVGMFIAGLGYAVAFAAKRDRVVASVSTGFAFFVALFFAASAASYVGGSAVLNPAVAMTVQALKFETWPLVAYALGPVIGAVLAFFVYDLLKKNHDGETK